jgi:DNA-binding response OmpR family regulator
LLQRIWAYKAGTRTRTLDVHIQRLRRKLGPAGARILTIVRAGYMWRTEGTVQGR